MPLSILENGRAKAQMPVRPSHQVPLARLLDVDPLKPEEIHVGAAVTADFEEIRSPTSDETMKRLIFRPA